MKYLLHSTVIVLSLFFIPIVYSVELQERFIDSEYGYSIRHPSSWKAKIHRSGIVLADINSDDDKSGLQIRVTNSSVGMNKFIDNYIDDFTKTMRASLMDKAQTMTAYLEGYTLTFRSNRAGREYFLKTYVLPIKNKSMLYVFQAGTPFEMKDQVEPILDAIADSFRLE